VEELLIVLVQFLFDLLFDTVVSIPFDWLFGHEERARRRRGLEPRTHAPILLGAAVVGTLLGAMSLVVMPKTLLRLGWLRMLNLVLAPALAGTLAFQASRRRRMRGAVSDDELHAMSAALLSFAFVAARFLWGVRGP
jgi:hypothetical protein